MYDMEFKQGKRFVKTVNEVEGGQIDGKRTITQDRAQLEKIHTHI